MTNAERYESLKRRARACGLALYDDPRDGFEHFQNESLASGVAESELLDQLEALIEEDER